MMRFEDVLPALVRVCEMNGGFGKVTRACVVRDLRGRVHLALESTAGQGPDAPSLETALQRELGRYFEGPVWLADAGTPDQRRLAQRLLQEGQPWDAEYEDPNSGARVRASASRWLKIERRLSKQAWLREIGSAPTPPWPLVQGAPAIAVFYSFKGGVGRTTALVSCAWQLAQKGHRVAVVDMDLEAPGLGVLLGAEPGRGVIDYLVDHIATDSGDLTGIAVPAIELGEAQQRVSVFPAGALSLSYLEKLSRLDFNEDIPWDPTSEVRAQKGLVALLKQIRQTVSPDYILLDSRAGLHDVAGLSLHGLSHVAVLLSRASEQGYLGLDLMLQVLSSRELRCALVHALAPAQRESEADKAEQADFRQRVYDSVRQHVYERHYEEAEVPSLEADDQPHSPLVLHYDEALRSVTSLEAVTAALDLVEQRLAVENRYVFAAYDHLDRIGSLHHETRRRYIKALLVLWLSLSNRYRWLRSKIFLREDLFEPARLGFPDATKLRARSASLDWDVESLYRVVVRHLGRMSPEMRRWLGGVQGLEIIERGEFGWMPGPMPEGVVKSFADRLAGELMGSGVKKGYTYRWIPNRLQDAQVRVVPRSILTLLGVAARTALGRDFSPQSARLLTPQDLAGALPQTSVQRVAEVQEEYPLAGRLENLRSELVMMSPERAKTLLSKRRPDEPDNALTDGAAVLEELIALGVLSRRKDGRIDVPDIYRYGFGIKRKGGVARPR